MEDPKHQESADGAHRENGMALPPHLAQSRINLDYGLGEVLSRDDAGVLYAATKEVDGKSLAVNVLNPDFCVVSKNLIKMEHPNICTAHASIKSDEGTCAIVFEKPEGKPLTDLAAQGMTFSVNQSISAVLQLLSAIHAIHKKDETAWHLNANNIFLYNDENNHLRLKLVNCGVGSGGGSLKSPHYFSPERILNAEEEDKRSDIWAAGAILYHLISGHTLFDGESDYEIASKNLLNEPNIDSQKIKIPEALAKVLTRALNRDVTKRYQDVSEMVSDLLPLRETFNEPMSKDVGDALRHSCPPGFVTADDVKQYIAKHRPKDANDQTDSYDVPKRPLLAHGAKPTVGSAGKGDPKKNPNRTLLGIPSVSEEVLDERNPRGASRKKRQKTKNITSQAPVPFTLFDPRSLLGTEKEIAAIEKEMKILDRTDDGDVITAVQDGEKLADLASIINDLPGSELPDHGKLQDALVGDISQSGLVDSQVAARSDNTTDFETVEELRKPKSIKIPAGDNEVEAHAGTRADETPYHEIEVVNEHFPYQSAPPKSGGVFASFKARPTFTKSLGIITILGAIVAAIVVTREMTKQPSLTAAPTPETPPVQQKQEKAVPFTEVVLEFVGMPKGSQMKVNGAITQPPLRVIQSPTPINVTVSAKGYETWSKIIIPKEDRKFTVEMLKDETASKKRSSKKKKRRGSSSKRKSSKKKR